MSDGKRCCRDVRVGLQLGRGEQGSVLLCSRWLWGNPEFCIHLSSYSSYSLGLLTVHPRRSYRQSDPLNHLPIYVKSVPQNPKTPSARLSVPKPQPPAMSASFLLQDDLESGGFGATSTVGMALLMLDQCLFQLSLGVEDCFCAYSHTIRRLEGARVRYCTCFWDDFADWLFAICRRCPRQCPPDGR